MIQPTSCSFSTQGADGTAWQLHRIKTRDCFSAVPSTNFFPRPCDFCRSTSLVLCVVFSYCSPDWWTICSFQILQSPNFLPEEVEWGVKHFRSGFDDPSCRIEHVDSFHSWQRADYLCFLDILSCFLRIFFYHYGWLRLYFHIILFESWQTQIKQQTAPEICHFLQWFT